MSKASSRKGGKGASTISTGDTQAEQEASAHRDRKTEGLEALRRSWDFTLRKKKAIGRLGQRGAGSDLSFIRIVVGCSVRPRGQGGESSEIWRVLAPGRWDGELDLEVVTEVVKFQLYFKL